MIFNPFFTKMHALPEIFNSQRDGNYESGPEDVSRVKNARIKDPRNGVAPEIYR